MSENIEVVANWLKGNWSGKWVATTPTFVRVPYTPQTKFFGDTNYIVYEPLEFLTLPASLNKEWWNYILTMKFTLVGTSRSVVQDLFSEVSYIRSKYFYAAPWFPKYDSSQSETLCHLNFSEGTGTSVADSTTTYNFTFGSDAYAPSWVTTGALYQANFVRCADANYLFNGTLLDTMPTTYTIEIVCRSGAVTVSQVKKVNSANDSLTFYPNNADFGVRLKHISAATTTTITGGVLAPSVWSNVMATGGARGMELFINGIMVKSSTITTVMENGTTDSFYIENASGGGNFDICRCRVSSVQRLPFDSMSIPQMRQIEPYLGADKLYSTEVFLQGKLSSVYLGRPSYG